MAANPSFSNCIYIPHYNIIFNDLCPGETACVHSVENKYPKMILMLTIAKTEELTG